ncbi:Transcriptional activators [Komagataella phaffii CBS 7435]|uniref:Sensor of mitochondrial dysfunction n=2 Tax=Komagataella phaffii TaxID=460519 RepID=C4R4L3_KOMPG|nr:Sensor of mitochondrial dysfunction [Komagataella phaffii GS115]AOA63667.1 GQ67_03522T0 [Komagataella phaffii]CAH2449739.1 Transcriptional activators [Komagataella phaffii CBS 7435]AOA69142.1 GQ68_03492T0 [Komagataella phaffii GS115]CAY70499.1 Sensor of mitochondrial dysfunction [Komagataella phaffii GS115]CCA39712.1 Transcriptional activators [Komagataella phaffii CBS 7435]
MSTVELQANEAEIVARSLVAIVDIGSNGIRFSVSSTASHHARIMPCVFKDRLGISLFDAQLDKGSASSISTRKPIPQEAITEICLAMKRFQLICEDFGVSNDNVKIVATEATREAPNSKEFRDAIAKTTGWEVELLSKEDEGRCGAFGVASSFHNISGIFMDVGGGSTQLSWVSTVNGDVRLAEYPISLPYGAAALTQRLLYEDEREVYEEVRQAYELALEKIKIPTELIEEAEKNGGFNLYTCGGGFRGVGHLLLHEDPNYPIQTIINGYTTGFKKVELLANYLLLKKEVPNFSEGSPKIFRVSERRKQQLPAVGLLMSAAFQVLPKIRTVSFSEGGVREGVLYSRISPSIRSEDPLLTATRPYAPLLSEQYRKLLLGALPEEVPSEITQTIVPALCNIAFVHCSYPKELQPTAALHMATSGIIAGTHGLSHKVRALIGLACCERWGFDLPESEEVFYGKLEKLVIQSDPNDGERLLYWTKYCGKIMFVICGVHPGGNIRPGVIDFNVIPRAEANKTNTAVQVGMSANDVKSSYTVKNRIASLQRKIKKLNKSYKGKDRVVVEVEYRMS